MCLITYAQVFTFTGPTHAAEHYRTRMSTRLFSWHKSIMGVGPAVSNVLLSRDIVLKLWNGMIEEDMNRRSDRMYQGIVTSPQTFLG